MKVIRFLSRFTLVCNICFVAFAILRWLEIKKTVHGQVGNLMPIPFVKSMIITLGFTAIIINVCMNLVYLALLLSKKLFVPRWMVLFNFIMLLVEFYYFS